MKPPKPTIKMMKICTKKISWDLEKKCVNKMYVGRKYGWFGWQLSLFLSLAILLLLFVSPLCISSFFKEKLPSKTLLSPHYVMEAI